MLHYIFSLNKPQLYRFNFKSLTFFPLQLRAIKIFWIKLACFILLIISPRFLFVLNSASHKRGPFSQEQVMIIIKNCSFLSLNYIVYHLHTIWVIFHLSRVRKGEQRTENINPGLPSTHVPSSPIPPWLRKQGVKVMTSETNRNEWFT